jgi:hypothetical protein
VACAGPGRVPSRRGQDRSSPLTPLRRSRAGRQRRGHVGVLTEKTRKVRGAATEHCGQPIVPGWSMCARPARRVPVMRPRMVSATSSLPGPRASLVAYPLSQIRSRGADRFSSIWFRRICLLVGRSDAPRLRRRSRGQALQREPLQLAREREHPQRGQHLGGAPPCASRPSRHPCPRPGVRRRGRSPAHGRARRGSCGPARG